MIEKSLNVPAGKNRSARFCVADLTDGDVFPAFNTVNLREEANGFVAAEGSEFVFEAPEGTEEIYTTVENCFAYADKRIYIYDKTGTRSGYALINYRPNEVGYYYIPLGYGRFCAVNDNSFQAFTQNSATGFANSHGGTSFVVINDRVFLVNGLSIHYTGFFDDMETWAQKTAPTSAGTIPISNCAGNGLKLVGRNGFAYLFLEYDIWRLEALAEPANFKIKEYRFSLDRVHEKSVADCGEHIYFCTERGMYSFDGSTCRIVEDRVLTQVDFSQPVRACCAGGRYYATAIFTDGTRGMFVYDDHTKRMYRLDIGSENIASTNRLHYMQDGGVYRFTGRHGFPTGGSGKGILETGKFRPNKDGRFVLQAVSVEGEGEFCVEAASETSSSVEGGANCRLVFPVSPRGETLSLRITTPSENARIFAITLEYREVKDA